MDLHALSRRRDAALLALLLAPIAPAGAGEADLVWHVEAADGSAISSARGDEPVNPASVVKVATALFALERLGPEHRYKTGFALTGPLDPASGTAAGDLVALGGDDPDFHIENALLVARRLNELGVRGVAGDLVVDERFWIGWERGAEGRERDATRRLGQMGERLRRALDPARWSAEEREVWRAWRARNPGLPARPPRIAISGTVQRRTGPAPAPLVVHRSNPLRTILKRLLAYSNNDIERVAAPLGGAPALEGYLVDTLRLPAGAVRLVTASGLGSNRMSPRAVVAVLHRFAARLAEDGLAPGDLLPMPGCDPGSLEHALPGWQTGVRRGAMAGKTGTLIREDGGVAALAGFLYGVEGTAVYMVAAPAAGARITGARRDIERWADGIGGRLGGPASRSCGAPVVATEAGAEVATSPSHPARLGATSAGTGR